MKTVNNYIKLIATFFVLSKLNTLPVSNSFTRYLKLFKF
jgi:hypothetical protein